MIIHRQRRASKKKYRWHGIANYDHDDERKKEGLDLSGKEKVYNDVALSGFVLPYFILRGRLSFIPTCRSSYGSDQITSRAEALYPEKCGFPLHRIGDVRGLGVTTSVAILASYASTFCPLSLPCSSHHPRPFFSWFNTQFGRPSSSRFGPARSRPRIGFSCERNGKGNARKRSFNLFSFQAKTFRFTRAKRFTHVRPECEFSD